MIDAHKRDLAEEGFTIVDDIYTLQEIEQMISTIEKTDQTKKTFRKSVDLFAIRQFLKEVPEITDLIFNNNLSTLIKQLIGEDYFVVKSIYFDKPETSNWYVPYHQDLTISVDKKVELRDFGPWTAKFHQFAVQPPIDFLENIFTLRIHLDDTDEHNGALKVIPTSHTKKIYRPETIDWATETETTCCVKQGGIMVMKPLLLHRSNRTTNNKKRRVIHLELSNQELPTELEWAECLHYQ